RHQSRLKVQSTESSAAAPPGQRPGPDLLRSAPVRQLRRRGLREQPHRSALPLARHRHPQPPRPPEMRPGRAEPQKHSVPRRRADVGVNAVWRNSTVALRKSSSARMSADWLPRNSAHPSGRLRSNARPSSGAPPSNNVKMSKKNKLTDSEHRSSKQP